MTLGVVSYNNIKNFTASQAATFLGSQTKLKYGSLTYSDLQINNIPKISIMQGWFHEVFGYGAYAMYDGQEPVYVGEAKNFLDRLVSHQCFDGREKYGFNSMARAAAKKANIERHAYHKDTFEANVLPIIRSFELVRVNCFNTEVLPKSCKRLESILMKGYEELGYKLFNSSKNIKGYRSDMTIAELINR